MNKQSIRLLSVLGLATLSLPAFATIATAAIVFKDASGKVYLENSFTAKEKTFIDLTTSPLTKKSVANNCGLVVVNPPSTTIPMPASITVSSTSDTVTVPNTSTLTAGAIPKCVLNASTGIYSLATPMPTMIRTATGQVVIPGKAAQSQWTASYEGLFKKKALTADLCGLVGFGSTSNPAPATFNFLGSSYTTSSLPTRAPSRCIKGVKYVVQPAGS